jgi:hypothetical protein
MKKMPGLSQLEEVRSWNCAVFENITSCNLSVDSGTAKYVIY